MTQAHGYAALAKGEPLQPFTYDLPELGPDDVEVAISHCGLCHSDISMIDNEWRASRYPLVPGHEVVGTVEAVGRDVRHLAEGDRVGIGWQSDACGHCEWCMKGEENFCDDMEGTIVRGFGGFADRIRVNGRFAIAIPTDYPSEFAGPLMCGGITVFTPLMDFGVRPGMKVGVVGIGGLGHLALQFANAMGCEVTAFSRSASKEREALGLGAHHYVATEQDGALQGRSRSLDCIINTVCADVDINAYLSMLRPRGSFVQVGFPDTVRPAINVVPFISNQIRFSGSPIGSPLMLKRMLEFANTFDIHPQIETFALAEVNDAIEHARQYQARYRVVLDMQR